MNEIIYILTNEAMPGYVKIGKTNNNLEQRVRELSASTSIPLPFTVFYARAVKDAHFVEHLEIDEMETDHIIPWHDGGKTTEKHCQMLCKQDNRTKSGK